MHFDRVCIGHLFVLVLKFPTFRANIVHYNDDDDDDDHDNNNNNNNNNNNIN